MMAKTNDGPVPVEQEDRDAAGRVYGRRGNPSASGACRRGERDSDPLVQEFARHRLDALASAPAGNGVDLQVVGDAVRYAKDVLTQVFEGRGRKMTGTTASNVNAAAHRLGDALAALDCPRGAVGEREDSDPQHERLGGYVAEQLGVTGGGADYWRIRAAIVETIERLGFTGSDQS